MKRQRTILPDDETRFIWFIWINRVLEEKKVETPVKTGEKDVFPQVIRRSENSETNSARHAKVKDRHIKAAAAAAAATTTTTTTTTTTKQQHQHSTPSTSNEGPSANDSTTIRACKNGKITTHKSQRHVDHSCQVPGAQGGPWIWAKATSHNMSTVPVMHTRPKLVSLLSMVAYPCAFLHAHGYATGTPMGNPW